MNIGVLGAGSWGIALSVLLNDKGHSVVLWEFDKQEALKLKEKRELPAKLPGIMIPGEIEITSDISETFNRADYILCVVPAQSAGVMLDLLVSTVDMSAINDVKGWIIATKGIDCKTLLLMSELFTQKIPGLTLQKLAALSGPSHAEEVSRKIPTTIVSASQNEELAVKIQKAFSMDYFRIYTNTDITGVELCASIKNVIAVAAGICDGLGFGDNTKGALLTRGMVEMSRLGRAMGARPETFFGLAGIGDLITTCISSHSRNRKIGELIGRGDPLEDALKKMTMVAEGVETTRAVYELSRKFDVEMPITSETYQALFKGKSPVVAVRELMMREFKSEEY